MEKNIHEGTHDRYVRLCQWEDKPGMCKSTFYKWRHVNKFPGLFTKLGGSVYVDTDKLNELMETGRLN